MTKRAPALGRKVKPGLPGGRIRGLLKCPWCERYHGSRWCAMGEYYLTPPKVIPWEGPKDDH